MAGVLSFVINDNRKAVLVGYINSYFWSVRDFFGVLSLLTKAAHGHPFIGT